MPTVSQALCWVEITSIMIPVPKLLHFLAIKKRLTEKDKHMITK